MHDAACDAGWMLWPYAMLACAAWIAWSLHTWVQVQRAVARAQVSAAYLNSFGQLLEQAAAVFRMYDERRRGADDRRDECDGFAREPE